MISAGGKKKDKNLTRWEIVGFKKSYYLNIPFKNLQKIRNTSKKLKNTQFLTKY